MKNIYLQVIKVLINSAATVQDGDEFNETKFGLQWQINPGVVRFSYERYSLLQ